LPDDPGRIEYQQRQARLTEHLLFDGAPFELPLPGGRWIRVQRRQGGNDGRSFCTHVDITHQKAHQAELLQIQHALRSGRAALREKTSLLETMLERMEQGVLMVNAQGVVEICNRKAMELLELPPALMADKPHFDAVLAWQWSHDEFRRSNAQMQEFIRGGAITDAPQCYERTRPNGRVLEIQSVPLEGGGMLRTYTDITARKHAEAEIRYAAQHDPLTGLANRRAFEEALADAIGPVGGGRHFALHFIDLDRFKTLNDRYGHAVGDQVLVAVSQRMRHLAREADTVARLGGDEFAIVQYGCDDAAMALNLGQRVLDRLQEPLQIRGADGMLQLSVGASIGIALYPESSTNAAGLMANADRAMYAAKAGGGHGLKLHPPPAR
jgi:diguanylate cyclase (GGDEF)-like protein